MASEFKNTEAFVKKYGKDVEKEIKTRLTTYGKQASGKLYKSIRAEVKEEKSGFLLTYFKKGSAMDEYGAYVDKGVSGHGIPEGFNGKIKPVVTSGKFRFRDKMPPDNSSIRSWMRLKGIPKTASFLVRRSIWIFGIAPTQFFTIPTTRRQKQLETGIEKNMALDFEQAIAKDFKKK